MARLAQALALIGMYETQGVSPEDVLEVMEDLLKRRREEQKQQ